LRFGRGRAVWADTREILGKDRVEDYAAKGELFCWGKSLRSTGYGKSSDCAQIKERIRGVGGGIAAANLDRVLWNNKQIPPSCS